MSETKTGRSRGQRSSTRRNSWTVALGLGAPMRCSRCSQINTLIKIGNGLTQRIYLNILSKA